MMGKYIKLNHIRTISPIQKSTGTGTVIISKFSFRSFGFLGIKFLKNGKFGFNGFSNNSDFCISSHETRPLWLNKKNMSSQKTLAALITKLEKHCVCQTSLGGGGQQRADTLKASLKALDSRHIISCILCPFLRSQLIT